MSSDHLSPEEIKSYVNCQFEEDASERIIIHLSECDMCLVQVDQIWADKTLPGLSFDDKKLEKRLMHHINRSNMFGSFVRLGVNGFINAIFGLLTPFFKVNTRKSTSWKK